MREIHWCSRENDVHESVCTAHITTQGTHRQGLCKEMQGTRSKNGRNCHLEVKALSLVTRQKTKMAAEIGGPKWACGRY